MHYKKKPGEDLRHYAITITGILSRHSYSPVENKHYSTVDDVL